MDPGFESPTIHWLFRSWRLCFTKKSSAGLWSEPMASFTEQQGKIWDQNKAWVRQQRGVTGVAEDGRVYTDHISEETKQAIRNRVTGIPVFFQETGRIVPLRSFGDAKT
jgi:hypothetical protein